MASFSEQMLEFLGLATKKSVEELQNQVATQELLAQMSEERNLPSATNASSLAREVHDKDDVEGLVLKRVKVKDLQLLYLNNQFVFRGVNVRADELITRGYKVLGGSEAGRVKCLELIHNSGGDNLFWQLSVNGDTAGDAYLEKIYNKAGTEIKLLKHINPVTFGFATEPDNHNKIEIDKNGNPVAYEQVLYDVEGKEKRVRIPLGKIEHLRFNTFGDEFNGVSSLQPVYNTCIRLMNMEHAAAEAAVKTANPTWVVRTTTKSPRELNLWAKILGRISAKEVLFLPDGVNIDLMSPGNQNFNDYAEYFLDAVVAALGVPKTILTGSGGADGSNRATTHILSKHFYSIIRANQRYVEEIFNNIFKEYGRLAGFDAPQLRFNDIAEDADRNGQRAVELYVAGLLTVEEARQLIGLDTSKEQHDELQNRMSLPTHSSKKIDPDMSEKKEDMEVFFPEGGGHRAGSQKGKKREQKYDPNVPSVH
jgi:hypothetical protein